MSVRRYPTYKSSDLPWLGNVPTHWSIVPYKRLVDIQNGADHKEVEQDHGYPVIGSGGPFAFAKDYLYDGESVLLGRKGTIDKPLFVTGKFWTVDTMYWTKIAPDASGRFVYYMALTIPFYYYSTNTALPSMTRSALGAHIVARPPLEEQLAIAAFLDRETAKIDALIAEQERLIDLLQEKRQAVISQAVTKGLDPTVPMKDSEIEWLRRIPTSWSVLPLKRLGALAGGSGFPHEKQALIGEELPFFKVADLGKADDDRVMAVGHHSISRETAAELRARIIPPGAIVYAKIGAALLLNRRRMTAIECCIDNNMTAFVPDETRISREFALQALGALDFGIFVNPGAVPSLSEGDQAEIRIALPPTLDEQQLITDHLRSVNDQTSNLITAAEAAIVLLAERRAALISAAVTGKIDVREIAASEPAAA